jgi:hypothetical protein
MKKIFSILIVLFTSISIFSQVNSLSLQGIIDFDLISAGYTGKAIHLVANNNVPDLSVYGIGVANNASGGDGQEYSFPQMSIQAGEHLLLARDSLAMSLYFDVCFTEFDYVLPASNAISQNGNDAIELFYNSIIIETFGDVNVDGTGTAWEYLDSWAYKDPSGSVSFSGENWIFGGVECTIGSVTTMTSPCPYPLCTSGVYVDNKQSTSISIYPNPSSDYIILDLDSRIKDLTIHDALGKEINDIYFVNNKLNISDFPNGVYFINANNQGNKIQQKFIKY